MTLPVFYRPNTVPFLDYSFTLDGVAAPATDDNGTEWWPGALDGWAGTAEVRTSLVARPQDHGAFNGPSYYGARVITIDGTAIAVSKAAAYACRDIIGSVCHDPAALYTLVVTEPDPDVGSLARQCDVRLTAPIKISNIYSDCAFDWNLQLVAPDPRRYSVTTTTVVLSLPTAGGSGLTFPVTFPVTWATSVSGNSETVTNRGTFPTRPVVVMAGPLVNPSIANVTAGRTLTFNLTVNDGDTLTVDFDRRTALLNGTASRTYTIAPASAWWEIGPGNNDIVFTDAAGGAGTATVTFKSAWA